MNILIVGRGWVGTKMYEELVFRGHSAALTDHESAFGYISKNSMDWVINCAGVTGYPNVDACEKDPIHTMMGNAVFPIKLYTAVEKQKYTRFAHFSSGCIYQGDILDVDAEPNFFGSIYSISKGVSDVYLKDKVLNFRIRMPFTGKNESKNYLQKIINYTKTAKLFDGGLNSLTDLDEAVLVACDCIEQNLPNGAYNLVNKDAVNMHDVVSILGLNEVEWFDEKQFLAATAARRSNCVIPHWGGSRLARGMSNVVDALERASKTLEK